MQTSRARTIPAPAEAVWAVLADFAAISSWASNVDHSCVLREPEVGEMVGTTRRIQTGRTTLVERITLWDPAAALAYDIEGLPPVLRRVTNRWDLAPGGARSTTVRLTTTVDAGPRPPQRLIAAIAGRVVARQSDVMLDGLAERLRTEMIGAPHHG